MRCAVSERVRPSADGGQRAWSEAFAAAGIELVVVRDAPNRARFHRSLEGLSAVVLTDAGRDGSTGTGTPDGPDPAANRTERELVRFARSRGLPVVGIGHGARFLVRYFGGQLIPRTGSSRAEAPVNLRFVPGQGPERAIARTTGSTVCDPRTLPATLSAVAFDEHDQIAGFVHRTEPILGVHWLPVDLDDGATRWVLDALRPAAAEAARPRTRTIPSEG